MNLLIINNHSFHYEIIESIIVHYDNIISINKNKIKSVYLKIIKNDSFCDYIKRKYPFVQINNPFLFKIHYLINVSIYGSNFHLLNKVNNSYYISHEVTDELKKQKNVFFTTPLCKTQRFLYFTNLPFSENKINTATPVFIVQGELKRRNWNIIKQILERKTNYDFKIRIIGKGNIPTILEELQSSYSDKIEIKQNLNFIEYHKEFIDCFCIIPCISFQQNPCYYKNKLTSSINYGLGYNLYILLDERLQAIYNVKKSFVYNYKNLPDVFNNCLDYFYK